MDPKQYAALFFYYSLRGNPEILMDIVTDLSIRDSDALSVFLHHLSSMFHIYNENCFCSNSNQVPKNNGAHWRDELK